MIGPIPARAPTWGALALAVLGCVRPPLRAERQPEVDAPVVQADGGDANDAMDANDAPPSVTCEDIRALARRGVVTPRHARQALFAPDGRTLVLWVVAEGGSSGGMAGDELLRVSLPDGAVSTLAGNVIGVEWLGASGELLVTSSAATGAALSVVPADGRAVRPLAQRRCDHVASRDGSRVFVLRDCDSTRAAGALDAVETATGATRAVAATALRGQLAVSPGGLGAYVTPGGGAGSAAPRILHVVDGAGHDQALATAPGAFDPAFVGEGLLLFMVYVTSDTFGPADIYRHVPGDGDRASSLVAGRHPGFGGYRSSPDGTLLLAARWLPFPANDELYAVRLDGSGEALLANDLYAYQMNQIGPSAFAFTARGDRIVYLASKLTTASVARDGTGAIKLSDGSSFAISPFQDRVASVESNAARTLHVTTAASGTDIDTFSSGASALGPITFVPGDRGLLFRYTSAGNWLLYMPFSLNAGILLGSWDESRLVAGYQTVGEIRGDIPIDPTGCFAVLDSDRPDATQVSAIPGTSLVPLSE